MDILRSLVLIAFALMAVFLVVQTISDALLLRKMRAAPRVTKAEVDRFWAAVHAASLPMAKIRPSAKAPPKAHQSRIGGRAFAGGQAWPVSPRDGRPMLFLAQINFADLPQIEDFPASGLLQVFVSCDGQGNIESTEAEEDRVLRWFSEPAGDETLPLPSMLDDLKKPGTLSRRALAEGIALNFKSAEAKGNPYSNQLGALLPDVTRQLGETKTVQAALDRLDAKCEAIVEGYGTHWVGGHPRFVQDAPRDDVGALDRVLLHLGFDDDVCLGDAGELNLLISKQDLQRRDFSRALCYWDCA